MKNLSQPSDYALFFEAQAETETSVVDAYDMACAYPRHETAARKAGFDVTRHGTVEDVLTDLHWTASGRFRGRHRDISVSVTEAIPPVRLHVVTRIDLIDAHSDIQFFETGRNRCQIRLKLGLVPHTLAARLLIQPLRLSRPRITRRLTHALTRFARKAERRARRQA